MYLKIQLLLSLIRILIANKMTRYQCHTNDDEQTKCVMLANNVT